MDRCFKSFFIPLLRNRNAVVYDLGLLIYDNKDSYLLAENGFYSTCIRRVFQFYPSSFKLGIYLNSDFSYL